MHLKIDKWVANARFDDFELQIGTSMQKTMISGVIGVYIGTSPVRVWGS